jgi:hypothetical protein
MQQSHKGLEDAPEKIRRGGLQWSAHKVVVEHALGEGGVLEPWASSDLLGKSGENSGGISSPSQNAEFWQILGILHHQTASFAGAPITSHKSGHVTQLRARVNVSCSRAGHKRGQRDHKMTTKGERGRRGRLGSTPGYQD